MAAYLPTYIRNNTWIDKIIDYIILYTLIRGLLIPNKIMKDYINVTRFTDIDNAFRKFQEYVYFDATDLHVRAQLVEFINKGGIEGLKELIYKLSDPEKNFKEFLDKIDIRFFPKKVTEKNQ